jgi:hypothetical protein
LAIVGRERRRGDTRRLFASMLGRIAGLSLPSG